MLNWDGVGPLPGYNEPASWLPVAGCQENGDRMNIFCSQELAARLEQDEVDKLAASIVAARERDPGAGFFAEPLAGGLALWGGAGSPVSKVAGLGFGGELDPARLDAIEAAYREKATPVRVELASLADPEIGKLLTRRGYQLQGFENVLGRQLTQSESWPPAAAGIAVKPLAAGEEDVWLDAMVDGFATPDLQGVASDEEFPRDVLAAVLRDLTAAADYTRYLAHLDGHIAGGASLRIAAGVAQLAGAATVPACRRRGVQSALLQYRLAAAAAAGCDIAVVTTQPGSKSQQNAQRQGFELLHTRAVLVLAQDAWPAATK